MSVLIKGIDLPEAYTSVWLTVFECVGEHTFMKTHKVSAEQIQAIPPHGRLIDEKQIPYIDLNADMPQSKVRVWTTFKDKIDRLPTIIEAEEEDHAED